MCPVLSKNLKCMFTEKYRPWHLTVKIQGADKQQIHKLNVK